MNAPQKKPSNVESSITRSQSVTFGLEKVARETAARLEASPSTVLGSVRVDKLSQSQLHPLPTVWRVSWKTNA